jgi:hypothetical protein
MANYASNTTGWQAGRRNGLDHNPHLRRAQGSVERRTPARGSIVSRSEPNLAWQTRAAPPTEHENALADALEKVFEDGAEELSDVVAGLNRLGVRAPDGTPWTTDRLAEALCDLAR